MYLSLATGKHIRNTSKTRGKKVEYYTTDISRTLFKGAKLEASRSRPLNISMSTGYMIVKVCHPFSVAEDEGFKYHIYTLILNYKIPN
jgi:hypothetical protein